MKRIKKTRLFAAVWLPLLLLQLAGALQADATTFIVSNLNNSGAGSLRQAITDANADNSATAGSPHQINVTTSGSIAVSAVLPTIANYMVINGNAGGTTIDGGGGAYRLFVLAASSAAKLTINGATIKNVDISGLSINSDGAGFFCQSGSELTLNDCALESLKAYTFGAAIYAVGANVTATRCTFRSNRVYNSSSGSWGGAVGQNGGTAIYTNCTFTGNISAVYAGAIFFWNAPNLTLTNCTISGNSAGTGRAAIEGVSAVNLKMINCIVYSNTPNDLATASVTLSTNSKNIVGTQTSTPFAFYSSSNPNLSTVTACGIQSYYPINSGSNAYGTGTTTGAPVTDVCGSTRSATAPNIGSYEASVPTCTTPTAYTVGGGGAICVGNTSVAITLSGSQTSVNYQLKLNGNNVGSPVAGTGSPLTFSGQTGTGTYTITAADASTGTCTATMTGNATAALGPVKNTNTGAYYCSIQAAINDAGTINGHTITVNAGTYNERVTVSKSLTIQGANKTTTIVDGTGLGSPGSGFYINNGVTGVTIRDLTVQNFSGNGPNGNAGIYAVGGNDNLTIRNTIIKNNLGGSGIYANGPITNVLIDANDVSGHSNIAGAARGIVIWNGLKSNVTITNNEVYNNNCCGIELQDGTATGVTMTGNNVHDNSDNGMGLTGLQGPGANSIASNTVTNNGRFGIEVKMPNGSGAGSGPGSVVLSSNTVSRTVSIGAEARDIAGIAVFRRGYVVGNNNADIPTGAVVTGNTVSGYNQPSTSDGFGIVVEGTNHTVSGNTVNNNDVGIQRQAGHTPYTANTGTDGDQSNLPDQLFGRGNSPVTCAVTVTGNNFSGNTVDTRDVGSTNGNGFVSNTNTGKTFCSIQAAIDDAATLNGHTLVATAGTYAENISVTKSLTILGPNANNSGCGSRVAEAVIIPATTETSVQSSTSGTLMRLGSSGGHIDVTIKGFTLDGHNPALTNGVTMNGVEIHTGAGITNSVSSFDANPNAYDVTMDVENNIIQNLERYGVLADNIPSRPATAGTIVSNNKIDNLPGGNAPYGGGRGRGIAFEENVYGTASNNCISRVNVGWQDDNYNLASPGSGTVVSNNTISSYHRGIFHNLQYQNATAANISNNTISAEASNNSGTDFGLELASIQSGVGVTAAGNNISNKKYGILLWNCPTSNTVNVSGGTLTNNNVGIYVTGTDPQFGAGSASSYSLSNITVNGGVTGLSVDGNASVASLNNVAFSGQSGSYIELVNGAMDNGKLNATTCSFGGLTGATASTLQNFSIEDKIFHAIDDASVGFVRVKNMNAFVTNITTPTATNNDYTRLKNAVEAAEDNWTINNRGTFDWTEANAAASWAKGNDGLSSTADDYSLLVPANRNGVTFTAPLGIGTAAISGPGDLPGANLESALYFDGSGDNQGWTISNMTFSGLDLSIGMFFGAGGGSDAYNNTTITNNVINIPTDLNTVAAPADVNQNIGLHYSFGANQTISNNTFNIPGDGVSNGSNFATSVAMQSNTSGGAVYNGLNITGNTINVLNAQSASPEVVLGIYENAHGHSSTINVSNNSFINQAPGNDPALNLQRAFRVTSHSSGSTTVTYSQNTVHGANIGFQWLAGQNFSGNSAVQLTANTITGCDAGVVVQSNGRMSAQNNFITGGKNGIVINDASIVTATENDLSANSGLSIQNNGSVNAAATCNWYGTNLPANVATKVSGSVTYNPYLYSGVDNSASPGFQASPSSIALTSAGSTTNQTLCINSTLTSITYATGNTGSASFSGLPNGVTGTWVGGVATISGVPTQTGTFNYSVITTGCNTSSATGTIIVVPNNVSLQANNVTVSPAYPMPGGEIQTIYLGYPTSATSVAISATATGGTGAYTFDWVKTGCNAANNTGSVSGAGPGSTASTLSFTPNAADACVQYNDNIHTFTVTATDANGCASAAQFRKINVVNPYVSGSGTTGTVQICHRVAVRGGSVTQTLQLPQNQVPAHLAHADYLGNCNVFTGVKFIPAEELEGGEQELLLYPNPTTGIFILELNYLNNDAVIQITDIQGRVVATKTMPKAAAPTATMDISSLAKGMYLVQVRDGEASYNAKIVVQ